MKRDSNYKQKLQEARKEYETTGICCCPMCGREIYRDVGDLCLCGFDLTLGRRDNELPKKIFHIVAAFISGVLAGIFLFPLRILQLWVESELGIELSELVYIIVLTIVALAPLIILFVLIDL